MKHSILNRLNRVRKSDGMFTTRKHAAESRMPRTDQFSIEHRTEIQLELQELRKMLLESKTLEQQFVDLCGNQGANAFQAEVDENVQLAKLR